MFVISSLPAPLSPVVLPAIYSGIKTVSHNEKRMNQTKCYNDVLHSLFLFGLPT